MRPLLLLPLLAGCSSGGGGGRFDLAGADLVRPADLGGSPADLAGSMDDLAGSTDDLAGPPPDLAGSPADLATPPADLAAPRDFASAPDLAVACTSVKVNEVQVEGPGGASDESIELYNACQTALDLSAYKLVYRSAAGVNDVAIFTFNGHVIGGRNFLLLGSAGFTGQPDVRHNGANLAGAGGGLALVDPNGGVVDSMGYGNATNAFVETAAAPAPQAGRTLGRLPDGRDTNNNAGDFALTMPTPKLANRL